MRIGLVGFGTGGRVFHLPYIQAAREWELAGVVTRSVERREQLNQDAPGVPAFDTLDDLLREDVDAVVITTPPETREKLVLQALEGGANVVADKPFAPSAAEAQRMVQAAAQTGLLLTVFHNRRWDTDVRTLKRVLEAGDLGRIWRAVNRFDLDEAGSLEVGPAHGLLRDLGSHLVDQSIHLFGPVARVDGHLDWLGEGDRVVDAGFSLGLHHASGVFSQVSASKVNHMTTRELTVYAEHGSYESHMRDVQTNQIIAGDHPLTAESWGVEDEHHWGVLSTESGRRPVPSAAGDYTEYYRALHASVARAEPFPVSLRQAIHTLEVLDAARESDRDSRSVELAMTR